MFLNSELSCTDFHLGGLAGIGGMSTMLFEQFRTDLIALWMQTGSHDAVRSAYLSYRSSASSEDALSATFLFMSFLCLHGKPTDLYGAWAELEKILALPLSGLQRMMGLMEGLEIACAMGDVERGAECRSALSAFWTDDMAPELGSYMGRCQLSLGTLARFARDYDKALAHYLDAGLYLTVYPAEVGDGCWAAGAWLNASEEYARLGDLGRARHYLNLGVSRMPPGRGEHDILIAQAVLLSSLGQHAEALVYLNHASEIATSKAYPAGHARAEVLKVRCFLGMNNGEAAVAQYDRAYRSCAVHQQTHWLDEIRQDLVLI